MNKEIIIINDEPFYRIKNGTSYDYAPIPKQFKPYFERLQQENQKCKEVIDKAIELLGNYKHYSTPDEKQNGDNEDLVNNAFNTLKEVSE